MRSEIESAVSVANGFHERAVKGDLSEAEAQKLALTQIHDMQWNSDAGYVFVFDSEYVLVTHPVWLAMLDESVRESTDQNGKLIFQVMHDADIRDGHGLTCYDWPKPSSKAVVGKVTYRVLFKPRGLALTSVAGAWKEF